MFKRFTASFLIITLSIICSACAAAPPRTPSVAGGSSSRSPSPAPMRLACEPLAFVNLQPMACAGTVAADPAFDANGSCVCRNTDYAAVPNGLGKTCLHVEVIAALMRLYADFLDRAGVPDPVVEIEPYIRVEPTENGFELHHAPPPKKTLVEASWFKRDVTGLLQNIRTGIPRDAIECRIGRIQRAAAIFIHERPIEECFAIAPKAGKPGRI